MNKLSSLIFVSGLTFLLMVITFQLPIGQAPMLIGQHILSNAVNDTGVSNIVTSVVLAYRGLDTLGELSILFAAASVVGLVLNSQTAKRNKNTSKKTNASEEGTPFEDSPFVVKHALDLLFPLLLIVGFYVIFHGHLTPGGGFQGGVIIAVAFFMQILAHPKGSFTELNHNNLSLVESLSGSAFIIIGLFALFSGGDFLQPLLTSNETNQAQLGNIWSAGTLPLLYIAVGLKVGSELSSLLMTLYESTYTDELVSPKGISHD